MATSNPWDVLPRERTGDPAVGPIYAAVGEAASAWELLAFEQMLLYEAIVNSRSRSAGVGFGLIISARSRSGLLVRAADRVFFLTDPDLLEDITALSDEIVKLSGRRNDIVHGVAVNHVGDGKTLGFYLVPSWSNSLGHLDMAKSHKRMRDKHAASGGVILPEDMMFNSQKYAYTARQIMVYAALFRDYRKKFSDMASRVHEKCAELWPLHDRHPGLPIPRVVESTRRKKG